MREEERRRPKTWPKGTNRDTHQASTRPTSLTACRATVHPLVPTAHRVPPRTPSAHRFPSLLCSLFCLPSHHRSARPSIWSRPAPQVSTCSTLETVYGLPSLLCCHCPRLCRLARSWSSSASQCPSFKTVYGLHSLSCSHHQLARRRRLSGEPWSGWRAPTCSTFETAGRISARPTSPAICQVVTRLGVSMRCRSQSSRILGGSRWSTTEQIFLNGWTTLSGGWTAGWSTSNNTIQSSTKPICRERSINTNTSERYCWRRMQRRTSHLTITPLRLLTPASGSRTTFLWLPLPYPQSHR
jgi:hypothetical protein